MSTENKIVLAIVAMTLAVVGGAAILWGGKPGSTSTVSGVQVVAQDVLVRPDSWAIGTASARLTVVEFSDFQCPSCKAVQPYIDQVLAKYGDKIRFVYREFPLPSHAFGMDAAVAAEAAGKQGKFWGYHDKLFAFQPEFQQDKLLGYAKDLGLDVEKFKKDLDSDEARQRVLTDQGDGNTAGVNATPTFFFNGVRFTGNFSDLESEVASRLK